MSDDVKDAIKVAMTGLALFPIGISLHCGVWAGLAASGAECIVIGIAAAVAIRVGELKQ